MKVKSVTCLNCNRENKIRKPIKDYLDLFINTSLNHMSLRSHLVSQLNEILKQNSKINGTVRYISDFREPNKRIKRKLFPIPKHSRFINEIRRF